MITSQLGMNDAVHKMKKTPGRYFVTNQDALAIGMYIPVEVDADGKVWQLNPEDERDGELDDGGWYNDTIVLAEEPSHPLGL